MQVLPPQQGEASHALAFQCQSLEAEALLRDNRMRQAGAAARSALSRLDAGAPLPNSAWRAAFIAGAGSAVERDAEEGAYWMSVAYALLGRADPEHDELRAMYYWARFLRRYLDEEESAHLVRRLAEQDLLNAVEDDDREDEEALVEDEFNRDARMRRREPPDYPSNAAQNGWEGFALIQFTVDETGRTTDLDVLFSIPHPVFGEAGLRAVRRWRYDPKLVDGEPVPREGVVTEFEFVLE